MAMEKRLIDINEAGEYLRVSKNTIYSWICQRKIPFVKMGRLVRFDLRDIDKWVEKNKVNPVEFDFDKLLQGRRK
jgi:excisionase family DNA binding protein